MSDIFISYSSADRDIVKTLAGLFEQQGWSVWWDRDIPIGQHYDTVIENELKQAACVVVVWTQRSINSEWVKNEALEAAHINKLVPVLLEKLAVPLAFKRIETAKLYNWDGDTSHPELELLFHSIHSILQNQREGVEEPFKNQIHGSVLINSIKKILKPASLAVSILVLSFLAFYYFNKPNEASLTVRIFDWKKLPIPQGDIKIYLPQYIRTQSVDKMGQAFFNGIPKSALKTKMKIEINSPGYVSISLDTLFDASRPLELSMAFSTQVIISGKVKTAAEFPIRGVEVNVEGTKYFDLSKTDGSYKIRLEKYTLGDDITITTSHKDYEDKSFIMKISAPEILSQDIFLNPVPK
ncbi:MAG: toll/interleukin-1 receptor domain-containing protein [Saprospiraceae bacterium]|nr:toll/interleukin-1 receptor domain-containing protein [Saprospiraceae bacterium]